MRTRTVVSLSGFACFAGLAGFAGFGCAAGPEPAPRVTPQKPTENFLSGDEAPAAQVAVKASTAEPTPPIAARQPKPWTLHGRTFTDDYAWLKKKDEPKVLEHLRAENAYADAMMAPTAALQSKLYAEMVGRMQEDDQSPPVRRGAFFTYQRQVKGQEHPIHCRKKGNLDAKEEVLLDLNQVAVTKKFAALGPRDYSRGGRYFAYALDTTGFRQFELRVRDLEKLVDLPDRVERVTSVAFANDEKTLFYSVEDPVAKRSHRVYRHTIGDATAKDSLLFEEKDERFEVEVERSRSEGYIALISESHTTTEVRLVPADRPLEAPRVVLPRAQDVEYEVEPQGDRLLVRINDRGRNFRVVTLSAKNPDPVKMVETVPHRADVVIDGIDAFRDHVVYREREGGLPRLTLVDGISKTTHVVAMPEAAYEVRVEGNEQYATRTLRYVYQSPTTPPLTIDYDVDSHERRIVKRTEVRGGFDRERYKTERVEIAARDGRKIPVTLIAKKDARPDGSHPVILYGYGAYGYATPVTFSSPVLSLVDRGVIWAIAHVRGGGEFGKTSHDQGRMANKKHSFEDFVDAADALTKNGWARAGRIGAWGGSAGGLLVAASTNMRPDLFRVVVAEVPFVDVLNTMLDETLPLTVGEFEEWGNPKKPEELAWMAAYSPYDNLAAKPYPAMLVRTSYNDSQVMYWEPAKYVARLRATKQGSEPVLFKTLLDPAGHGGKSGRYEKLKERASDYAFVLWQLGVWNRITFPDASVR